MSTAPYHLSKDSRPRLGLVVLQVDEVIEQDFRASLPKDVRLHVTRVGSGDALTPQSIAKMKTGLTAAAALLPPAADFDVIGYACTSGTALIGAAVAHDLIRQGARTAAVTDPMTAAVAMMQGKGISRIGIVSPYVADVAEPLAHAFEEEGIFAVRTVSFGEQIEAKVARIAPDAIASAARKLVADGGLDGIFLSCTNLQTSEILAPLQSELGLPVMSSNQVLAWHMLRLARPALVGRGQG